MSGWTTRKKMAAAISRPFEVLAALCFALPMGILIGVLIAIAIYAAIVIGTASAIYRFLAKQLRKDSDLLSGYQPKGPKVMNPEPPPVKSSAIIPHETAWKDRWTN